MRYTDIYAEITTLYKLHAHILDESDGMASTTRIEKSKQVGSEYIDPYTGEKFKNIYSNYKPTNKTPKNTTEERLISAIHRRMKIEKSIEKKETEMDLIEQKIWLSSNSQSAATVIRRYILKETIQEVALYLHISKSEVKRLQHKGLEDFGAYIAKVEPK